MRLKELRKEKGFLQSEIAKKLSKTTTCICDWERGRTQPSIEDLSKLADFFNCSIDYLVGREDDFGNVVSSSQLTDQLKSDEQKLLRAYRAMPDVAKRKIVDDAEFYAYEYQKSK